jgi:hypothetical protein
MFNGFDAVKNSCCCFCADFPIVNYDVFAKGTTEFTPAAKAKSLCRMNED